MRLDTLNRDDLFKEISELARDQGVSGKDEWMDLIDEVVESHLSLGELDPDQEITSTKEHLREMWDEYQRESGPESAGAVAEDPDAPHA